MNIKYVDDYFEGQIKFLYPSLRFTEFKRIMEWGFTNFNLLTKKGADVSIKNWRYIAYCGKMFHKIETWAGYMYLKHKIKLRLTYKYAQRVYDGLYYFGINDYYYTKHFRPQFRSGRRNKIKFKNVKLYKIKEEAFLTKKHTHFFMMYYPLDVGWSFFEKEVITRNYKEIAYRDKNGKIVLK